MTLATNVNLNPAYFPPWAASTAYALGAEILDPAGHIQKVTTAGTSGSSIPTFNDSSGTTTDGSAVWTDQGARTVTPSVPSGYAAAQWYSDDGSPTANLIAIVPEGVGTFYDEVISMSGTSGAFSHSPTTLIGLFKNGQRLTTLGSSPDFSYSGTGITLTVAAVSGDFYEAVYWH
jgi:hypothetical protein